MTDRTAHPVAPDGGRRDEWRSYRVGGFPADEDHDFPTVSVVRLDLARPGLTRADLFCLDDAEKLAQQILANVEQARKASS